MVLIGSIAVGEIRCISSGILPNCFSAFSKRAEQQPNKSVVLPVTIVSSCNSMAATGPDCVFL